MILRASALAPRPSEQLFVSAFEYAAIGMALVSLEGHWIKVNRALCLMLGYSETEFLATSFQDVTHPDDLSADLDNVAALLAGRIASYQMEKRYRSKGGGLIWTILSVSLVRDPQKRPVHFISQIQDISERKRAEIERDSFFRLSLDLLCVSGFDGYFREVNPAWTATLGWSKEELLARPVQEFVHPDDLEALSAARALLFSGQPLFQLENRYRCEDGTYRWLSWQSSPSVQTGTVFGVARDVTRRKQTDLEMERAREAAEAAVQAKASFLAMMSHEIRTPMNAVIGFGDLLADTPLSPDQAEFVASIQKGGANLIEIIDGILDYSKIEAGRLELRPATLDLRALLGEVHRLLSPLAQLNGISFERHWPDDLGSLLVGDELALRRILTNLAGNAIKFTERGLVRIDVAARELSGSRMCEVRFSDTGIGLTEDALSRIFQPFLQGDPSHHRQFGGTGLGLVISRRLAEAMDGTLTAAARSDGPGAVFTFTFPWLEPTAAAADSWRKDLGPTARLPEPVRRRDGMRVLLAEDNQTNRKLMIALLGRLGCVCRAVENGEEALLALESETFDVVLMDLQMPVLDGWEATRTLRQREAERGPGERQYVVAQSAYTAPEDLAQCRAVGMDAHLSKPVTLASLAAVLNEAAASPAKKSELNLQVV